MDDLARRRALLTAALGFALVDTKGKPAPKEIQLVREWLDNWKGLGLVATAMARQGYRLHLTNVDESMWRATFSGSGSSLLASGGFGADPAPWRAVQLAAWTILKNSNETVTPTVEDVVLP